MGAYVRVHMCRYKCSFTSYALVMLWNTLKHYRTLLNINIDLNSTPYISLCSHISVVKML